MTSQHTHNPAASDTQLDPPLAAPLNAASKTDVASVHQGESASAAAADLPCDCEPDAPQHPELSGVEREASRECGPAGAGGELLRSSTVRKESRAQRRGRLNLPVLSPVELPPLPDAAAVLADLPALTSVMERVLIGPWTDTPYPLATHYYTDEALLAASKAVPYGSANAVQRVLQSGERLSMHHLIQAGRVLRHLPDLRTGVPTRGAMHVVVLQPQHFDPADLSAFLTKIAGPGARVTLIGFEPFIVSEEVDAVVHPLHRGLSRLNSPGQRQLYKRFSSFPLEMTNDAGFDHVKKRFGTAKWSYSDAITYLNGLPSMKRLLAPTTSVAASPVNKENVSGFAAESLPFSSLRNAAPLTALKKAWGGPVKKRLVRFPLVVRTGFINNG